MALEEVTSDTVGPKEALCVAAMIKDPANRIGLL